MNNETRREAAALLEEVLNCGFMTDEAAWKRWVADWRPRALKTVAELEHDQWSWLDTLGLVFSVYLLLCCIGWGGL